MDENMENKVIIKIGNQIRTLRKKLYMTQTEFADKLKLAQPTVGAYETGIKNVPDRTIFQICDTFNVNESWLRHGQGKMFKENDLISLDELAKRNNLSETECEIIKIYMSIDPDVRKYLLTSLKQVFLKEKKSVSLTTNLKLVARGGETTVTVDKDSLKSAIEKDLVNNENNNNDLY